MIVMSPYLSVQTTTTKQVSKSHVALLTSCHDLSGMPMANNGLSSPSIELTKAVSKSSTFLSVSPKDSLKSFIPLATEIKWKSDLLLCK